MFPKNDSFQLHYKLLPLCYQSILEPILPLSEYVDPREINRNTELGHLPLKKKKNPCLHKDSAFSPKTMASSQKNKKVE